MTEDATFFPPAPDGHYFAVRKHYQSSEFDFALWEVALMRPRRFFRDKRIAAYSLPYDKPLSQETVHAAAKLLLQKISFERENVEFWTRLFSESEEQKRKAAQK